MAADTTSMLEDDVFNSPPSASSRRRRLAEAVAAARARGASPSPAAGSWMRPRLGSSVAGLASTSPPQISLRDIRKVTTSSINRSFSTQLSSWVASASEVWTQFATSSRPLPTGSFTSPSRRNSTRCWQICSVYSSTRNCRQLVSNSVHDVDATQLDSIDVKNITLQIKNIKKHVFSLL